MPILMLTAKAGADRAREIPAAALYEPRSLFRGPIRSRTGVEASRGTNCTIYIYSGYSASGLSYRLHEVQLLWRNAGVSEVLARERCVRSGNVLQNVTSVLTNCIPCSRFWTALMKRPNTF